MNSIDHVRSYEIKYMNCKPVKEWNKCHDTVARTATIRDGVWTVNWIYWITIQYTQLQCKHFTANSQLSLSDVLSGWQPHLWHPLPSLNSSA
jgi:hypothetical protein